MTARIVSVGDAPARRGHISDAVEDGVSVTVIIPAKHVAALKAISKRNRKPVPANIRAAITYFLDVVRA